jgi:hypothetical protein
MNKGLLCVDLSLVPNELEIVQFFMILEQKGIIFYDSRKNPKAVPPYAILGGLGDVTVLDIANDKVKAKFDLMIKLEELEDEKSEDDTNI